MPNYKKTWLDPNTSLFHPDSGHDDGFSFHAQKAGKFFNVCDILGSEFIIKGMDAQRANNKNYLFRVM